MLKLTLLAAGVLLLPLLLASCSGQGNGRAAESAGGDLSGNTKETATPVHLKMYALAKSFTDEEFKQLIQDPVHKKYPNIDIEYSESKDTGEIADLVAAKQLPDLIYTNTLNISDYTDLNAVIDLTPLIKENGYDLGKLDPTAIAAYKQYSDKGQLYGLPASENGAALYYNKDLFDKFGVPYPKDGMTWETAIEIGKKVGRVADGIQYRALDPNGISFFVSPYAPVYIDPKTNKAALANDQWSNVLRIFKEIKDIPGNTFTGTNRDHFMKDQDLAMLAAFDNILTLLDANEKQGNHLNWDMVSYPSFKDKPGVGLTFDAKTLMISSSSSHKKETFQVMEVMTSDEVQLLGTRNGRISALKDAKFKTSFGADMPALKGKNLQGLFKTKQAVNPPRSLDVKAAIQAMNKTTNEVLAGKDINTALREAEEQVNQEIAQRQSK